MTRRRWVDVVLMAGVLALVAVALIVGAGASTGDAEPFGGTDAAITEQLESDGYQPWFRPLFAPGSGEVESGLFAVQAALGAGVLGYCLGVMRGRRQSPRRAGPTRQAPRLLLAEVRDVNAPTGADQPPATPGGR